MSLYKGGNIADCPIDEVKISFDKVEVNDEIFMEKGSRATEDMAKEALAKLLQTCLFRGGGLNSLAFRREGGFPDTAICMECFDVTLDGVTVSGLTSYLDTHKPIGKVSDRTYMEILTRDDNYREVYLEIGKEEELSPKKGTPLTFTPRNDYTVFFLGIKKGGITDKWDRFKNFFSFNLGAAIFGNSDTYFTFISESNKIPKVCEAKVN